MSQILGSVAEKQLRKVNATGDRRGTLGTGQRFTPKKRTILVIHFESEIDRIVYQLYDLTEEEIKIVEQS